MNLETDVQTSGILQAAHHTVDVPDDFCSCSIQLAPTPVRDQMQTGRCWIEASLGELEYNYSIAAGKSLPVLSSAYIAYYDLRQKVHLFLQSIYNTRNCAICDAQINYWLAKPIQDAGQWKAFDDLVETYGLVPESNMPSSVINQDTHVFIAGLNQKLRRCASIIRNEDLVNLNFLEADVFELIDKCLGSPPRTFQYANTEMKPIEFYRNIVKPKLNRDYISIVNIPSLHRPYFREYRVKWLYADSPYGSRIRHFNVPIELFRKMAVEQLKNNIPVWIGADAEHYSDKNAGIFDMGLFRFEELLKTKLELSKGDAALYKDSAMSHAMLLWGVDLEHGTVSRWSVRNSFGSRVGQNGYAYMSAEWFDRYVYQIVIRKDIALRLLEENIIEKPQIEWLQSWDSIGCLA